MMGRWLLVILLASTVGWAQERDFLTEAEVVKLREIQEPNLRLQLYALFAKTRLDQIESLLSQKGEKRARLLFQTLEDYTKILDAMDTVADDGLKRGVDLSEGIKAIVPQQKEWLARLQKVESSEPADVDRYQFQLRSALETTKDSLELNQDDLTARAAEVKGKEAEEKAARKAMMSPEEAKERKAEEAKAAEDTKKAKRPTLLRKGEVPAERGVPPPKK